MIEQALYEHLQAQAVLSPYLAKYDDQPAIFNQEAPSDADELWGNGPQYGRIVFAVDIQGDPERTMGGTLVVDIMCHEDEENPQYPEDIEPIIRKLIHGYFFSKGKFVVAAQWKNSSYFSQPTDQIKGCTVSFDLLAFPRQFSELIDRFNEWTCDNFDNIHVINHNELPDTAWKPEHREYAVYWRYVTDKPAGWIPDTFQTVWRTATVRCHIFAKESSIAGEVARTIQRRLYAVKRLFRVGDSPIMVNRQNSVDNGADALRTGQLTVEATYGEIVHIENTETFNNISYESAGEERSV